MQFEEMSIERFTEELASTAPVPGGGGAAALAASLGASLAAMAAGLTQNKPKYMQYSSELAEIISEANALSHRLNKLIESDAQAFMQLREVYTVPKSDPHRGALLENALRAAAEVPMEILMCACTGVKLHAALENMCSALLISDVAAGVALCRAAAYASAVNVLVNTKIMADRAFAQEFNAKVQMLLSEADPAADGVFNRIWSVLA